MSEDPSQLSLPNPSLVGGGFGVLASLRTEDATLERPFYNTNSVFVRCLNSLKLVLLFFVILSFSTDIRVSLSFSIDPNARPTFQIFEFFAFPLLGILIIDLFIKSKQIFLFQKEDISFLLFILWALIICPFAFDSFHAFSRTKDFFIAWVLFVSVRNLKIDQVRKLLGFSLFVVAIWSIFGAMQMLEFDPWFGSDLGKLFKVAVSWKTVVNPITGEMKDTAFAQGIYLYPQNYTYYVLLPLFISAGLIKKHKGWIALFLLTLLAMVGSGSKTFYIMMSLYLLWLLFKRFKFNNMLAIIMCVGVIWIGTILGIMVLNLDHILATIGNLVWRIEQWSDAITMLLANPSIVLTGHGTEYLEQVYSRFQYPNPHDAFLYFLIEYGIVGLFFFAGFVTFVIKKSNVPLPSNIVFNSSSSDYSLFQGMEVFLFRGLLFLLAMTILDDFFVQTQLTAMFMFYLGALRSASVGHLGVAR